MTSSELEVHGWRSSEHRPIDPRLGWVSVHDPRSLDYPVRASLPDQVEPVPKTWQPGAVLDQDRASGDPASYDESGCVGHGWTADLIGSPRPDPYTDSARGHSYAVGVYQEAKDIWDEWSGGDYQGTSVLAGARCVQSRGFIEGYRWCLSIEDVRDTVVAHGPVVIGVEWLDGMFQPRASGLLEVTGSVAGGHCLWVYGYHPSMRITGEPYTARYEVFKVRNSWGPYWGRGGSCYVTAADMETLLTDTGEACSPAVRQLVRLP